MRGYIDLPNVRILGARIHVHWSALVVAGILFGKSIGHPLSAIALVVSYFGIIVLHEWGHAFAAKKLGYRPLNIGVTFMFGFCEYEAPHYAREDYIIAWGGVLAQFAVAIPLIVLTRLTEIGALPLMGPVIAMFGYFSIFKNT